jgi:hypothetical protein
LLSILALDVIARLVLLPTLAEGFDLGAHDALSDRAVRESGLDAYLKDHLGFPAGIETRVNDSGYIRTVERWIRLGSQLEDSPAIRARHHFHNPALPWDQAGLLFAGTLSESSVLWGQDRGQSLGAKHSWHDARADFLRALTDGDDFFRQIFFRRTLQSLGHLIHLVQDAAVPAHTRNDPHVNVSGIGIKDGFETWAEQNVNTIRTSSGQPFDPSILTLPPNSLAPVAIARIIDTERYRQTGVPEAGLNIGIAEYSNANFFSDDTIFGDFPFPASTSVVLGDPEPEPKRGELRRYFRKFRDGQVIDHVAVPSALYDFLPDALKDRKKSLDDKVLADYGRLLLPRGIGYSAGLLNYFFRGTLNFTVSAGGAGGQSVLKITNTSSEEMQGRFTLYADNSSDARSQVDSFDPLTLGPGASSTDLFFTPPSDVKAYILVFEGKLGNPGPGSPVEEGAVVGKVKPVSCTAPIIQSHNTAIGGSLQVTITKPAGTAEGDLLIAHIAVHDTATAGDGALTPPSGWTQQEHTNHSEAGGSIVAGIWTKIAEASEPADYTWTQSGTTGLPVGAIIRITGPGLIDVKATNTGNVPAGSTGPFTAPDVTTTKTNTLLLRFLGAEGLEPQSASPPAGHTELYDTGIGFLPRALVTMAHKVQALAGAVGTAGFTISGTINRNNYIAYTVAICVLSGSD